MPTGLGGCYLQLACILSYADDAPGALEILERAELLLAETGDEDGMARVANERGNAYATLSRCDEADRCYEEASRRFEALGARGRRGYLANNRAWSALQRGADDRAALEDALALIEEAREVALPVSVRGILFQTESEVRYACGDHLGALEAARNGIALATEAGNVRIAGGAYLTAGQALLALGRSGEAVLALHEAAGALSRVSSRGHGAAVGLLVDALVAAGDLEAAIAAYRDYHHRDAAALRDVARLRAEIVDVRLALERTRHAVEAERLRLAALVDENALLREQRDAAGRAAALDALTGLPNRRALDDELRRLLERGDQVVLALADVDHFKGVNDAHSHLVGDEVLRVLARVLVEHCREEDVVARFGGEEFALVLPGISLAAGARICERVRVAVRDHPWAIVAPGVSVTISIGCADAHGGAPAELLRAADSRLYLAKRGGRDRVVPATP